MLAEVNTVGSIAECRLWEVHAERASVPLDKQARGTFGIVTGPGSGRKEQSQGGGEC